MPAHAISSCTFCGSAIHACTGDRNFPRVRASGGAGSSATRRRVVARAVACGTRAVVCGVGGGRRAARQLCAGRARGAAGGVLFRA